MNVYADTNFLSHLYLQDAGSCESDRLVLEMAPVFPITWLLRVELINAFEQSVLTGFGEVRARVTAEFAGACHQQFRDDISDGLAMRAVDLPLAKVTRTFEEIALRHTAHHGFRTYDILHVASALVLGCSEFWTFDKKAGKLAALEGLSGF